MQHSLAFVLSREGVLPRDSCQWRDLVEAQRVGVRSGTQLRLFRVPEGADETLPALLHAGAVKANGEQPFPADQPAPLICDALVPLIEPRSLWLGVYQVNGVTDNEASGPGLQMVIDSIQCLDCYALQNAANETCWFYPTDNGRYFSWENRRRIETLPGYLPDRPPQSDPYPYAHGDVHVLWSLMADDLSLTCVGLTYRRHRIEWPLVMGVEENLSTWTEFQVDSMAETSYRELNSTTVFKELEA
ncbi:MAG: hypothetical protein ACKO28_07270 [Cyanobium sp.]